MRFFCVILNNERVSTIARTLQEDTEFSVGDSMASEIVTDKQEPRKSQNKIGKKLFPCDECDKMLKRAKLLIFL